MRLVLDVEEDKAAALDSALFVRQMTEAGHVELDSAKRQFFNANLVARAVAHKGVPAEVAALSSPDATLHGVWEMQFNECSAEGTLTALHGRVWREVRGEHGEICAPPAGLGSRATFRLSPSHGDPPQPVFTARTRRRGWLHGPRVGGRWVGRAFDGREARPRMRLHRPCVVSRGR
ncbi:hypothetical protein [Streptomyces syringium]|uniref:hypothetical protein n=1 Tax=Streptomyces syringium TaxID=76729 RepID=UPI0033CE4FD8